MATSKRDSQRYNRLKLWKRKRERKDRRCRRKTGIVGSSEPGHEGRSNSGWERSGSWGVLLPAPESCQAHKHGSEESGSQGPGELGPPSHTRLRAPRGRAYRRHGFACPARGLDDMATLQHCHHTGATLQQEKAMFSKCKPSSTKLTFHKTQRQKWPL